MTPKKGPSIAELRVGVFVVVACAVLALAIFSIGSQVGLFQDQFWAVTYLSNVSGLKPGDVVLLGGVEVGNVDGVEITSATETAVNLRIARRVAELNEQAAILEQRRAENTERMLLLRANHERILRSQGESSKAASDSAREIENLEQMAQQQQNAIEEIQRDIKEQQNRVQNIEVVMRVNSHYRNWVRADSNISLGSIGLLGDKYIEIELGRSDREPPVELREVDTWLGSRKREYLVISGTQQASFAELITGANDILANFETLSEQVQDIVRNFRAGEGTVGRFLTDPSFYNNLTDTVENASNTMERISNLVEQMSSGSGTFTKLIQDDALYTKLTSVAENLEVLLTEVNKGEGTLGKLIQDPSIYDAADQVVADIQVVTGRLSRGEGTLGKLSTEDQLYVALRETTEELAAILKDVQDGKGTLGMLAKDERLYGNINEASAEVIKLLYDFRQDPKKFLTIKFELF